MRYNAKKMQQRNKSKHRSLTTKALMTRTLEMRGTCAVNYQKNNGLIEVKAVGKKISVYLNEMTEPRVLGPKLKSSKKFKESKSSKIFKNNCK